LLKSGFNKIDLKEIGNNAATEALKTGMNNLGMKRSTFNDLKSIFDAVKEGNLKRGLDSGLDIAIGMLPVSKNIKNIIKSSKDLILDKSFDDELKTIMKKQQNTISRIDKKCNQMEEAFSNRDSKSLDKIYKTLKSDIEKVMPIKNVIDNGNRMINKYELYKSKGSFDFTNEELELCNKLTN